MKTCSWIKPEESCARLVSESQPAGPEQPYEPSAMPHRPVLGLGWQPGAQAWPQHAIQCFHPGSGCQSLQQTGKQSPRLCLAEGAAPTHPMGPLRAAGQEGAARLPPPKADATPWVRPYKTTSVSAQGQWSPPSCYQGCPVPFPGGQAAAGDAFCLHLFPVAL